LTACACVSKYWRSRIRRTPGWRRVVLSLEATLQGHVGRITAVTTFDSLVVTGSSDGKIKFWDPMKGFACMKTLNITPSPVHPYLHPRIRELREAQRTSGFPQTAEEDETEFAEYPLAVTALITTERCVLIGAEDGRLIVWTASTQERREFDAKIHAKALNCIVVGGDEFIFTASLDGRVAAINRRGYPFNMQAPAVWQAPHYGEKRHDAGVSALAVAGGHLFSGALDGKIFVWQPHGMQFRRVLQQSRTVEHNTMPVTIEHTDRVTSMVGFLDRLYTASWDGTIKLWNARTLECQRDVSVLPIGICWSLAIRRDPTSRLTTLIAGVRDNDICVLDWETLEMISSCEENQWAWKLERHSQWVKCIMAFADGRIVSGSDDWTAKVWQIRGTTRQTGGHSLFLGLPPGPLSQEDLDILISQLHKRANQRLTAEQLQAQKVVYDKQLSEKLAQLTPEQVQQHEQMHQKQQANWVMTREKLRKERAAGAGGGEASSTAAASSSSSAAVTGGASATPGATVVPATPSALNPSGSPDPEAMMVGRGASSMALDENGGADGNGVAKSEANGSNETPATTNAPAPGATTIEPTENGIGGHAAPEAESKDMDGGGGNLDGDKGKEDSDVKADSEGKDNAEGVSSSETGLTADDQTAAEGSGAGDDAGAGGGEDEDGDDGGEGSDSEARVKRRKTAK